MKIKLTKLIRWAKNKAQATRGRRAYALNEIHKIQSRTPIRCALPKKLQRKLGMLKPI